MDAAIPTIDMEEASSNNPGGSDAVQAAEVTAATHDSDDARTTFDAWAEACLLLRATPATPSSTTTAFNSSSGFPPPPPTTGVGSGGGGGSICTDDGPSARLRNNARTYFASLSHAATDATTTTTTGGDRPAFDRRRALALLVASLGPALSDPTPLVKGRALHCLLGAVEGCCVPPSTDGGDGGGLTLKMMELIGKFFVEHCRPLSLGGDIMKGEHDNREGGGEADEVRDAAIASLGALVRAPLLLGITDDGHDGGDDSAGGDDACFRSMALRLDLAREGVASRCCAADEDPSLSQVQYRHGYDDGDQHYENGPTGGLSFLPRSKRSACFDVLRAAVDGVDADASFCSDALRAPSKQRTRQRLHPLLGSMAKFATFVSTCLHGETDPRCLLQMLHLIRAVLDGFFPWFSLALKKTNAKDMFASAAAESMAIASFPIVDLFDATAPYYPVQFTPPPNDRHGITKEGLRDALMAILCHDCGGVASADDDDDSNMTVLAARFFLERLVPPSAPRDVYGDEEELNDMVESATDKIEALNDLGILLLPTGWANDEGSCGSGDGDGVSTKQPPRVNTAVLRELSTALVQAHEQATTKSSIAASLAATSPDDDGELEAREAERHLADLCRRFASAMSAHLERMDVFGDGDGDGDGTGKTSTTLLWDAFVIDSTTNLSPLLSSSPQSDGGRAATAYLASLAAGGGEQTLRRVLDASVPSFLAILKGTGGTRDEEKMTAAAFGLGAFFSSCRAAAERRSLLDGGVEWEPHPLQRFSGPAIQSLHGLIAASPLPPSQTARPSKNGGAVAADPVAAVGTSLRKAAVRALEAVLLSTPASILTVGESKDIFSAMRSLADEILIEHLADTDAVIWAEACARTLGAVLGRCLRESNVEGSEHMEIVDMPCGSCILDDNVEVKSYIRDTFFPRVIASATSPTSLDMHSTKGARLKRSDWIVLARACEIGSRHASVLVVSRLVDALVDALRTKDESTQEQTKRAHRSIMPAMALNYVFRNGGENVSFAFQGLTAPHKTPMDVIRALCSFPEERREGSGNETSPLPSSPRRQLQQMGMSQLMLPNTRAESRDEAKRTTNRAYRILPYLIPAYERNPLASQRDLMIQYVSQILPPLSDLDDVKLSISLPILAATLGGGLWDASGASNDSLRSMASDLAEYALSSDFREEARSASASCIFSIVFNVSGDESLGRALVNDIISPAVAHATQAVTTEIREMQMACNTSKKERFDELSKTMKEKNMPLFKNTLNLMALVGSAAACRGGSSAQQADEVSAFLIQLACKGSAPAPETAAPIECANAIPESTFTGDGSIPASIYFERYRCNLSVAAAEAFGSMLSVQNGGPFWRQRVAHASLPIILGSFGPQSVSSVEPVHPHVGALASACHIVCCMPVEALGEKTISQLAVVVVSGLVFCSKNIFHSEVGVNSSMIHSSISSLTTVVLAALVKIFTLAPNAVMGYSATLVPDLLSICSSPHTDMNIPIHLMALQCLNNIAGLPNTKKIVKGQRVAVMAQLAFALDSPSHVVRQAAVLVRNSWSIAE